MSVELIFVLTDTFSRELCSFLQAQFPTEINLTPVDGIDHKNLTPHNIQGILYIPDANQSEKIIFELYPEIKRIALLDLFHFQFKDFSESFKIFPPYHVFTPRHLEDSNISQSIVPSFNQEMVSKINLGIEDFSIPKLCFISQPLMEERPQLKFNQHQIIEYLKQNSPIAFMIKRHPRERILDGRNPELNYQGSPADALQSFSHFIGFDSALLYSAEALGLPVLRIDSLEEINKATVANFLKVKRIKRSESLVSFPQLVNYIKEKIQ